jgi:hypothetical protein
MKTDILTTGSAYKRNFGGESVMSRLGKQPFSKNEMDYGSKIKQYSWHDVRREALIIGYEENNPRNNLPNHKFV